MMSIYLKNMAGEMIPMKVDPSASLLEIAQQASVQDPKQFPPGRTSVMRLEEEQKESLTADETLLVFITEGPYLESGVFPKGGKPYDRWVIPFRGQTLYLYTQKHHNKFAGVSIFIISEYSVSWSPEVTKPTHLPRSTILYDLMKWFISDVTPQEMTMLYDIVLPYYQELDKKKGQVSTAQIYNPSEPLQCGCGSIIKRKSLYDHDHTRKHKAWEKTQ